MKTLNAYIANQIKTTRETENISIDDLAAAINRSSGSLKGWESGSTIPSLESLYRIAETLNTDPKELIPSLDWYVKNKNKSVEIDYRLKIT